MSEFGPVAVNGALQVFHVRFVCRLPSISAPRSSGYRPVTTSASRFNDNSSTPSNRRGLIRSNAVGIPVRRLSCCCAAKAAARHAARREGQYG